jgi:hypothetical protein
MESPESDPGGSSRRNRRLERSLSPEDWTPSHHPMLARREDVALFLDVSAGTVDKHRALGHFRSFKDGDLVFIDVDSVFAHLERRLLTASKTPVASPSPALSPEPARRKRGRPRKNPSFESSPDAA